MAVLAILLAGCAGAEKSLSRECAWGGEHAHKAKACAELNFGRERAAFYEQRETLCGKRCDAWMTNFCALCCP